MPKTDKMVVSSSTLPGKEYYGQWIWFWPSIEICSFYLSDDKLIDFD